MANRFLVNASLTATWDNSNTAIWSATDGGATGASVPGASDDVQITVNSGPLGTVITKTATSNLNSLRSGHGNTILSLGSQLTVNGALNVGNGFNGGKLISNGQTIVFSVFANGFGAAVDWQGSTVLATSTAAGTIVNMGQSGFESFDGTGSTLGVFTASANARTISSGGYAKWGTLTYTATGSTGSLTITGNNTWLGDWNISDTTNARSTLITAGTTQRILGTRNIVGSSGKLQTLRSTSAGSPAILISPTTWFMGANSTNVSGNTGLTFTAGSTMDWLSVQDITGTVITPKTITGKARIQVTSTQTIAGKSRIGLITAQTQAGKARITASTSQTITGKADISKTTTRTQTGISRIVTTATQTQTGKARIQKVVAQTTTGISRITASTTRTIAGKADILKSATQIITGKARIQKSASQTITGKAMIATKVYTRETLVSLPTNNNPLATAYSQSEITDTDTDNASYVDQTGLGFLVHEFSMYNAAVNTFTPTWNGKSSLAATVSTIYLQVYNLNTTSWETLDTDNTTAANTELTLTGTQSTSLSNYYDARGFVYVRVYQEAA